MQKNYTEGDVTFREIAFSKCTLHGAVGENGAIIGLGQSVGQVGKRRLGVATSVPGLYLCGAEAGGTGVGIELAIDSAFELLARLGEQDPSWKVPAES